MSGIRKRRLSCAGSLIMVVVLVVLSCRLGPPRRGWSEQWGPVPPHRTFPGDCGICHVGEGWGGVRHDLSFDHERRTGYRLEEAHAHAACLRCHNDRGPVMEYVARGCSGCHGDPHASTVGSDCENCHGQGNWKPVKSAVTSVRTRFHLVPAHAAPSCATCHVEAGIGRPQAGPAQCGPCHQDSAQ